MNEDNYTPYIYDLATEKPCPEEPFRQSIMFVEKKGFYRIEVPRCMEFDYIKIEGDCKWFKFALRHYNVDSMTISGTEIGLIDVREFLGKIPNCCSQIYLLIGSKGTFKVTMFRKKKTFFDFYEFRRLEEIENKQKDIELSKRFGRAREIIPVKLQKNCYLLSMNLENGSFENMEQITEQEYNKYSSYSLDQRLSGNVSTCCIS